MQSSWQGIMQGGWCRSACMHAGVMMTATPPPMMLKAALDAGLLDLQHKALNATSVRPVQLDLEVLRLLRAKEQSAVVAKLLNCAQRFALLSCPAFLACTLRCTPGQLINFGSCIHLSAQFLSCIQLSAPYKPVGTFRKYCFGPFRF